MGRLDNQAGRHGTDDDRDSPWNLPKRHLPYLLLVFGAVVWAAFIVLIARTPRDDVLWYLVTTVLPGTGAAGLGLMVLIVAAEGLIMGTFKEMLERAKEKARQEGRQEGRQEQYDRWAEAWRKTGRGAPPVAPPGPPPRRRDKDDDTDDGGR